MHRWFWQLGAFCYYLLSPSLVFLAHLLLHTQNSTKTIPWLQVCLLLPVKHHRQYIWVSEEPLHSFCFGKQLLLLKLRPFCPEWSMAIIARNSVTFCRSSQTRVKQAAELVPFSSVTSWVILDRPYFQSLPILPDLTVWAEMLCSEYLLHTKSFEPIWDKTFQEILCTRQGKNTFLCPRSGSCFTKRETEEMWFHFNTQAGLVTQPPCKSPCSPHALWPVPLDNEQNTAGLSWATCLWTDWPWQNLASSHLFQNTHMHLNSLLSHEVSKNLQDLYCTAVLPSFFSQNQFAISQVI